MTTTKFPGQHMLSEINNLAAALFSMHGKTADVNFQFYLATCELGRKCWNAAVITYFNEVIRTSDLSAEDYLLPEFAKLNTVDRSSKQPSVTY